MSSEVYERMQDTRLAILVPPRYPIPSSELRVRQACFLAAIQEATFGQCAKLHAFVGNRARAKSHNCNPADIAGVLLEAAETVPN